MADQAATIALAAVIAVASSCSVSCSRDWDRFSLSTSTAAGGSGASAGAGGGTAGSTSVGGSGGSAGIGGSAGGAGSTVPADWTESFTAVYLFEHSGVLLGADATSAGRDLLPVGTPIQNTVDTMQGTGSLEVSSSSADSLNSHDTGFQAPPGSSFTFGAWFRATLDTESDVMGKDGSGYTLVRMEDGGIACFIHDAASYEWTTSSAGLWPLATWRHGVCRFDNTADRIEGFVDSVAAGSADHSEVADTGIAFELPLQKATYLYDGLVDEAFFASFALTDAALRRIYACGIDGSLCSCRPASAVEYAHCGRIDPTCSGLPPCNQATP